MEETVTYMRIDPQSHTEKEFLAETFGERRRKGVFWWWNKFVERLDNNIGFGGTQLILVDDRTKPFGDKLQGESNETEARRRAELGQAERIYRKWNAGRHEGEEEGEQVCI